jgi:hypothetical protein
MFNRYSAALLSFALVIVGALVAIPAGQFGWQAAIQLGILGVSTLATLGLPLVSAKWSGVFKTGSAVILAILSGLTPLVLGGAYNHATIGLIVLAALQAVASHTGIQIRRDAAAAVVQPVLTQAVAAPPAV